jgi:hypothetical protein
MRRAVEEGDIKQPLLRITTRCCCSLKQAVEGTVRIAGGFARFGVAECCTMAADCGQRSVEMGDTSIVRRRWENEGNLVVSRKELCGMARYCLAAEDMIFRSLPGERRQGRVRKLIGA